MTENKPNLAVLSDITFLFDANNLTCNISIHGGEELPLINKGPTNKDGYWFQLDDNLHHWISFNQDKFNSSKVEAFYKRPKDLTNLSKEGPFFYFRKAFKDLEKGDSVCIFSYSWADEWIKDNDGKWKSRWDKNKVAPDKPFKNHNSNE